MQSTVSTENVSISLPISDLSFLRTLSKKMGWSLKKQKKSKIELALDDVKAGKVFEASSVEDLMAQLEKRNTKLNILEDLRNRINFVNAEDTTYNFLKKQSQY